MALVKSNEGRSQSDINMTPLIDVMLVMLIIFIITIPSQTNAIKIDNPVPGEQASQATRPEVINLSIDFDGTLMWNNVPIDRTTMQNYISRAASKRPQPEVHISVNKFSRYEIVAQTLADLQHLGLKQIGFVNEEFF